jgi:hypothetical protein
MGGESTGIVGDDDEMRRKQIRRNQRALRLLRSWESGKDDEGQVRALEELKSAIDANRDGRRKHFS